MRWPLNRFALPPPDKTPTTWPVFSTWVFRWRRCWSIANGAGRGGCWRLALAALLVNSERRWPWRLLAAGYLPLGLVAVLLTASRGGFLAAVVALTGSGVL